MTSYRGGGWYLLSDWYPESFLHHSSSCKQNPPAFLLGGSGHRVKPFAEMMLQLWQNPCSWGASCFGSLLSGLVRGSLRGESQGKQPCFSRSLSSCWRGSAVAVTGVSASLQRFGFLLSLIRCDSMKALGLRRRLALELYNVHFKIIFLHDL